MVIDAKTAHRYGWTEPWDGTLVTPRQLDYLQAIESHWREHMRAPTLRELGARLGPSKNAVHEVIRRLRGKGLVTWDRGETKRSRTLRTTRLRVAVVKGGMAVFWDGGKSGG